MADYVQSGFTVSIASGLNVDFAAGVAHAGGVYMERDTVKTVTLPASTSGSVYLTVDENATAGALLFQTSVPSSPYVKLCDFVTGASTVTSATDKRPLAMFASDLVLKNAKWLKGLDSDGITLRNLIRLTSGDDIEVGDASGILKLLGSSLTFNGSAVVLETRKVLDGEGISGGGDLSADRTFDIDLATDPGLEISAGKLRAKAGTGLTRDANGLSVAYGTSGTTACVGNDSRLSDSRAPNGSAGGDLSGTYPNPTVAKVNGKKIAGGTFTGSTRVISTGLATVEGFSAVAVDRSGDFVEFISASGGDVTVKVWVHNGAEDTASLSIRWIATGT